MSTALHQVMHGVAIKKHGDAPAIAEVAGLPLATVERVLAEALAGGRVSGTDGKPVAGAKLDIWEGGADGLYDAQKGDEMNLRGVFRADAKGRFHFRCVTPTFYPVPNDGPVGKMLVATGRHPMRPPHLHFVITAPGYRTLVTHLFRKGGKYLDSDAVFGVKPELIVDFKKGRNGASSVHYDFVLMPEKKRKK